MRACVCMYIYVVVIHDYSTQSALIKIYLEVRLVRKLEEEYFYVVQRRGKDSPAQIKTLLAQNKGSQSRCEGFDVQITITKTTAECRD